MMVEDDKTGEVTAELVALTDGFFRAVSFTEGERPPFDTIHDLFIDGGRLIKNSGETPEISTVDEFIAPRRRSVDSGELTRFHEFELADITEIFGNVAHRLSTYGKRGVTNGVEFDIRGVISTQFIRTPDGWRISSMAWDDERPGVPMPARYEPAVPASRDFVEPEQLAGVVRAAFGPDRRLTGLARLRGGSKKGVYRLTLDDGATAVLYVWAPAENFWPERDVASGRHELDGPFGDASGLRLFAAAHARLDALGVRTPKVLFSDDSHAHYPADLAVVEDVAGGTLEALIERDPEGAGRGLGELAGALATMHRHASPWLGKVSEVMDGTAAAERRSAAEIVRDRALADLAEAATRVPRIAAAQDRLAGILRDIAATIEPRAWYGLIHGELGPDHVLIDAGGHPVLIDIEGLMFFDVEWEHVFLRIRFGPHYPLLYSGAPGDLDEARLRLYGLAQHLSLVAGPLRILDGDFPDRDFMREIAESHTEHALAFAD